MNLIPCQKFTNNTPWQQFWHIITELLEVMLALLKKDIPHAAEELVDLQTACETMLVILGYNDRHRATVRRLVAQKNEKRDYYGTRIPNE